MFKINQLYEMSHFRLLEISHPTEGLHTLTLQDLFQTVSYTTGLPYALQVVLQKEHTCVK